MYRFRNNRGPAQSPRLRAALCAYFQTIFFAKRGKKNASDFSLPFYTARSSGAGFSLVETLVAITILLIAILAPMRISSQSVKTAGFAREQLIAVFLAQEGIESIIHLRDADALESFESSGDNETWDWFDTLDGEGCMDEGCSYDPVSGEFISCDPIENCRLYFDESAGDGAYYTHSAGSLPESPFTRVVTIEEIYPSEEAHIVSTVSWESALTGDTVSVAERTRILDQYEQDE